MAIVVQATLARGSIAAGLRFSRSLEPPDLMAMVRYCFGCERRHYPSASGWYGSDWYDLGEHGVYFCDKHRARLLRADYQVIHPASEVLEGAMEQTANTGCRIVAAKFRYDCGAVLDAAVLLGLYSQWAKFDLFILLLAAQLYFPCRCTSSYMVWAL